MSTDEVVDAIVVDVELPPAPPPSTAAARAVDEPPAGALTPQGSTKLIDARGPRELIKKATRIANELDALVQAQGFRTDLSKPWESAPRWHLDLEAWQTLATLLGVAPVLRDGYPRPVGDRVRYTARVEHYEGAGDQRRLARITSYDVDGYSYEAVVDVYRDSVLISSARGRCDRSEYRWGRADEYALIGMAQTRATARAVKQAAGWIARLAGYEATPSAEVDVRTESGPLYGPAAAPELEAQLRRALAYMLDVDRRADGEPADEESFETVQDAMTALVGEADGYLPHVVARAVGRIAGEVKSRQSADAAPRNAADAPSQETR